MQIDIGFGDPLVPGSASLCLPAMLDFPAPDIQGYSHESMIAEKLQTMVRMGEINSRMKDFYDVWLLATHFHFDGSILAQAIRETFEQRQTALPRSLSTLSKALPRSPEKQRQWRAFIQRSQLEHAPEELHLAIGTISDFLAPVVQALLKNQTVAQQLCAGGPWQATAPPQPKMIDRH